MIRQALTATTSKAEYENVGRKGGIRTDIRRGQCHSEINHKRLFNPKEKLNVTSGDERGKPCEQILEHFTE